MPSFIQEALGPDQWPTLVLIATRLGGLFFSAPLWSIAGLSRSARTALVVLLSVMLLPTAPHHALSERLIDLPLPLATEFLLGVAVGLTASVLMYAVALAADVVSIQMGLSISAVLLPTMEVAEPGVGQLHGFLAVVVYLTQGGHLMLLRGLAGSLRAIPPGGLVSIDGGTAAVLNIVGSVWSGAVQVAAPIMVALLVVNVAIAILSKAVPQLNAMAFAFPVTISIGLMMVGVSLPVVARVVGRWVEALPQTIDLVTSGFTPLTGGP